MDVFKCRFVRFIRLIATHARCWNPVSRQNCDQHSRASGVLYYKAETTVKAKKLYCTSVFLILGVGYICVFHLFFLCVEISAVQVKPEDLGANFHPLSITSTSIKRPRMENSGNEINDTSSGTMKESTTVDPT